VVQILLAVLVGSPDAAPAVFTAIRDAERDADIVAVVGGTGSAAGQRIAEFIHGTRQETPAAEAAEAATDVRVYQRWCSVLARYSFYTRSLVPR
jgi:hypothetical protein